MLAGCSAHTNPATDVAKRSATLNAAGDCNGSSSSCYWYWQWGPHGSGYPSRTQTYGPVPSGWSGNVSAAISGLQPATTYDFQICGYAQGAWQKCYGPDGTENTHQEFTTQSWQNYIWYQSTATGGHIANDPNGGYTDTTVGANYLTPSNYVQVRNGIDAGSGADKCTTNGTGPMSTWTSRGSGGALTGLSVPGSQYAITSSETTTRNPLCQANGSNWGFYMDSGGEGGSGTGGVAPPDSNCRQYCNMQHSVSLDTCNNPATFNCRPWSASKFGGDPRVILASNYNPYNDCTKANGNSCNTDYHAYMCMWLQDIHPLGNGHPQLEYCVETWRNSPTTNPPEFVVTGDGGVEAWTRALPGTVYATKCTVTAVCPLNSSDTTTNNTLGSRTYAVTISASQLTRAVQDVNSKYGLFYSTNPSDYELTGIQDGNEGGYGIIGHLGSNVNGLLVATAY
ncbi:MAG TPA: hypothetical protein VJT75_14730 [Thermoleophilaceae bacterium]|nr:hypothetical protein [Thermoleophilaceae bacterium]